MIEPAVERAKRTGHGRRGAVSLRHRVPAGQDRRFRRGADHVPRPGPDRDEAHGLRSRRHACSAGFRSRSARRRTARPTTSPAAASPISARAARRSRWRSAGHRRARPRPAAQPETASGGRKFAEHPFRRTDAIGQKHQRRRERNSRRRHGWRPSRWPRHSGAAHGAMEADQAGRVRRHVRPGGGTDNFARIVQSIIAKHKLIDSADRGHQQGRRLRRGRLRLRQGRRPAIPTS